MFKKSLSFFFLRKLVLSERSGALIRRISILSFLGISLSVAVFFIVLFIMNGMNKNIRDRLMAVDPHLSVRLDSNQQSVLQDKDLYVPSTVVAYDKYDLIIRTIDGQFRGAQATGYDQQGLKFWMSQVVRLQENRLNSSDSEVKTEIEGGLILEAGEVALGIDLARSLGVLEGDVVTLVPAETLLASALETPVYEKVTVRKIITTDIADVDSKALFFNRDVSLKLFHASPSKEQGYHFWLRSISQLDQLKSELSDRHYGHIETWQEKNSDLFFALFMEKTMIGIFLGLAGMIASFSILTVLSLIMSQKKMDIAIIKTLGLSQKQTLKLFMTMGLWISLSALFIGSFVGISVSYYLQFNPLQVLPDFYYDSSIPSLVNLGFALSVIVVVSLLAVLGCYIPARSTLEIEPAQLLKSK